MEPKFKIGDYIQHKDEKKRVEMQLEGKINDIAFFNDNTVRAYLVEYNGVFAVLVENQDEYEKVEHK